MNGGIIMKKKVLAVIVAMALVLGTVTTVGATYDASDYGMTTDTGTGTVRFVVTGGPTIIPDDEYDDPDDPDDNPRVDPDGKITAVCRNINFGVRTRSVNTQTYSSLDSGVQIPSDERYTGIAVDSPDTFNLTVAIGHFKAGGGRTITGFNLDLNSAGADTNFYDKAAAVQQDVTLSLNSASDDYDMSAPANIFSNTGGSFGVFAGHWSGALTVPGGAVQNISEHGTAVMLWVVAPQVSAN